MTVDELVKTIRKHRELHSLTLVSIVCLTALVVVITDCFKGWDPNKSYNVRKLHENVKDGDCSGCHDSKPLEPKR